MNFLRGLASILAVLGPATGQAALVTLDFEGLSTGYYYYGGNQNLGTAYAGVTFGPEVTILDRAIYGYADDLYPPHSGDAVAFSIAPPIRVDFGAATDYVSIYYSSLYELHLEAFDAAGNLVASTTGAEILFSNAQMSVASAASDIAYVTIYDLGGMFTIDDLTYNAVPEPAAYGLIAATSLVGFIGWRRRRAEAMGRAEPSSRVV